MKFCIEKRPFLDSIDSKVMEIWEKYDIKPGFTVLEFIDKTNGEIEVVPGKEALPKLLAHSTLNSKYVISINEFYMRMLYDVKIEIMKALAPEFLTDSETDLFPVYGESSESIEIYFGNSLIIPIKSLNVYAKIPHMKLNMSAVEVSKRYMFSTVLTKYWLDKNKNVIDKMWKNEEETIESSASEDISTLANAVKAYAESNKILDILRAFNVEQSLEVMKFFDVDLSLTAYDDPKKTTVLCLPCFYKLDTNFTHQFEVAKILLNLFTNGECSTKEQEEFASFLLM